MTSHRKPSQPGPGEPRRSPSVPRHPHTTANPRPVAPISGAEQTAQTRASHDSIRDLQQQVRSAPPPPLSPANDDGTAAHEKQNLAANWLQSWQLWAFSGLAVTAGIGLIASSLLFRLPALPHCPAIFWPTASASLRLYCSQVAANKRTVKDLLDAIALVNALPQDHALRPEINRYIEEWSATILELAEEKFQDGELGEAIATANQVPSNTAIHQQVESRIQQWQSTWQEGEEIYQQAEAKLRDHELNQAFSIAVRLLSVDNKYWQTTKYQELGDQIAITRIDSDKLARARNQANQNTADSLLLAIKLAEEIQSKSYLYQDSRKMIQEFGQQMMDLARNAIDRGNSQEAIAIARKIPASVQMQAEVQDFVDLTQARARAAQGTVPDIEAAIAQARRLDSSRPLYNEAQQLINRWQLEAQDVARLEWARQLAAAGSIGALTAAIDEARLIPRNNPRGEEAQEEIQRWTAEIQTIEDQPYLDRAQQYAAAGDVNALQAAINEASKIGQGRALYSEAQSQIRNWRQRIQRIEDEPILSQARQLALSGNLNEAVRVAEQIQSGRALHEEAQEEIRRWQRQLRGQQNLREAQRLASRGTADGLTAALRAVEQVPSDSSARAEANAMTNIWSQELLRLAQAQARYDLPGAIAVAERIPQRASIYDTAQNQISRWQSQLNAAPTPEIAPMPPVPPPVGAGE